MTKEKKTSMVCFTDIPLMYSYQHCKEFGKFGIAFNRKKFIEYGANPVHYLTTQHNLRVKNIYTFLDKLIKNNREREWKGDLEKYHYEEDGLFSLYELFGFSQEYQYKKKTINYYQREWRLNYETLNIAFGRNPEKPGEASMLDKEKNQMLFDIHDIDFIVLPKSYKKRINELNEQVQSKVKFYENEVL